MKENNPLSIESMLRLSHQFAPNDPKPDEGNGGNGGGSGSGSSKGGLPKNHPQAEAWKNEAMKEFIIAGNSGKEKPWGDYGNE